MKYSVAQLDLNLLLFFDALMCEQNVSKAAERVCVSQPAMSQALKRLRDLLNDPILVKSGNSMHPTPLALSLEKPIRESLERLQQKIAAPKFFDPSTSQAAIVISTTTEYYDWVILPELAERFSSIAPSIWLGIEIALARIPLPRLLSGEVSFAVAIERPNEISTQLRRCPLIQDSLVCVVSKDHPEISGSISANQFSAAKHINNLEFESDPRVRSIILPSPIDTWFRQQGINRNIAVTTSAYMNAAMIAVATDYILTVPLQVAIKFIDLFDLKIVKLQFEMPPVQFHLIWHQLYENEPWHNWFLDQIKDVADKIREGVKHIS